MSTAAFLVIVKFVDPADLGLLGFATMWIAFLNVFTDLGFSAALVQRPTVTPRHVSSAFYLNLAVGFLLTGVGILLADPVAAMLRSPSAASVMRWLSLGCLLTSVSTVQTALAQRELRFADLARRDLTAMAIGGAAGVAVALVGSGLAGLVTQVLVASAVGTALLWRISRHRFSLRDCDRKALAELWTFGSRITAFGIFKYLVRNVDALLIGYALGPAPLGSYMFAQRVVLQPVAGLEAGVGTFVFARASAFQHDRGRLAAFFLAVFSLLNVLLVAWAVVVYVAGPPLLRLYFGPIWDESLSLIWMLAVVVVAHAAIAPTGQVLKALGRPEWLLRWSVGFTAVMVAALVVGLHWELRGAVLGIAAIHIVSLSYILVTTRRYLGLTATDWLTSAGPVYAAAAIVLLVVAALQPFAADRPLLIAGAVVGVIGVAVLAAWWRGPVFAVLKEPV